MNNLVIVNQSANYLMADIADVFMKSGRYDKVILLVGNPDTVAPLVKKGVDIDSFYPYVRTSMKSRLWSWVKGYFELLRRIKKKYEDCDLFFVSNPATVVFLPIFLKNNYLSLTYDLYPDGFLPSGKMTQRNLLFRVWSFFNKRFFNKAKGVFCITDGMAYALAKYCPSEKIQVVQLWGNDRIPIINIPKNENKFLMEHGIEDDFIICYSGNMGQGHDLLLLIEALNILRDLEKLKMVFIGEGYLKQILMDKATEYGLKDKCLFLPYQPVEMLPYTFSCSDVSVVSIHRKSVSMPSKTFDILRMGKPVIGIAEPTSSLSHFIKKNGFGEVFRYNEVEELASFIRQVYNNRELLSRYQDKSRACSLLYTKEQAKQFIL